MNKNSLLKSAATLTLVVTLFAGAFPGGVTAQITSYYGSYNGAPYWKQIANQTVVQGQTLSVSAFAQDDNYDMLTYSVVQIPANASFNPTTRVFSFTPSYNQLGSFPVILGVTDGKSGVVHTTFYVNVTTNYGHYQYGGGSADNYYNQAPYFAATVSHYAVGSGSSMSFTVNATDPENQPIRYSVNGLPAGASFDAETRRFSWTPERNQRGTYTLNFYATDGYVTSIPLNVTITVDGGVASNVNQNYYNQNQNYYNQNQNYYGSVIGDATQYYPNQQYYSNYNAQACSAKTDWPTVAVAGETYTYTFRGCDSTGYPISYQLLVGPAGASITGNVLTWYVPANVVNKDYQFTVSANNAASSVSQTFSIKVTNGTPTVNTVVTQPKTVVQYVNVPTQQTTAVNYYPTSGPQVYVNTGRTVTPVNYQYYTGGAYGNLTALPTPAVAISVFNIAVRVSDTKEMIVSWDTNKPTTGEVVFGYASQSRGSDLNRTILNYDFTTGLIAGGASTRHEISLGRLDTNKTYYLRVISRADNQTEISREIVFIPMTTSEGSIIIEQTEGAASAMGTLGKFLLSSGFLFFLLLLILGLIVYLIIISRRSATGFPEPELHLSQADHETPEHGSHH